MRSCAGCTKCCEGNLIGEAKGKTFYKGKPCHFVEIGKGCSIYKNRPKEPCSTYECLWKRDDTLPMWMKPSEVNAIVDIGKTPGGITFMRINEAGSQLDSRVLTWVIEYALSNGINLLWTIDGSPHWLGSVEFSKEAELL